MLIQHGWQWLVIITEEHLVKSPHWVFLMLSDIPVNLGYAVNIPAVPLRERQHIHRSM